MIKVLTSKFGVSVQDLGRTGFRNMGVPVSGAMDHYSAKLANLLVNNEEDLAVLEITFGGCKLLFESDCVISITGADFSATIDNIKVKHNSILYCQKGATLSFGKRVFGTRTYIAVQKGFQTEIALKSKSNYNGITLLSTISKRATLPIIPIKKINIKGCASVKVNMDHFDSRIIECYKGPEFDLLSEMQKQQLLDTRFSISSNNSRMGYQLNELVTNDFSSMLTSAVLPGTLQLTPSGKLIVLMRDCQVTGGYPRVLQLSENAIDRLGQKTTGDRIHFVLS